MDTAPKSESSQAPKKGKSWLSVVGLIIIVVLVIIAIALLVIAKKAQSNPMIQRIAELAPALQEMETLTQSQIEEQAQALNAADLGADPTGLSDRYYVVEGAVSSEESMAVDKQIAMGIFSDDTQFKGFILDQSVVLIDLTGQAPDKLPDGTVVRGYGRIFNLKLADVWKLPIVGPNLEKEFGGVAGTMQDVTFFLSKGIKIITVPTKDTTPLPADQADKQAALQDGAAPADGTAPPAEGAAPPAEGATPPAEGETAPPPAEGETTPPPAEGGK